MAKVSRILALLAVVAMLAALPMTALAQNEPPQVLIGTAMLNGATPPMGTEITAHDGAKEIGSAMTKADGKFTLQVMRSGGTVTFMIADVKANETLSTWMSGDIKPGFNLNATASGTVGRAGPPGPPGPAGAAGPAGPARPERRCWRSRRPGSCRSRRRRWR